MAISGALWMCALCWCSDNWFNRADLGVSENSYATARDEPRHWTCLHASGHKLGSATDMGNGKIVKNRAQWLIMQWVNETGRINQLPLCFSDIYNNTNAIFRRMDEQKWIFHQRSIVRWISLVTDFMDWFLDGICRRCSNASDNSQID